MLPQSITQWVFHHISSYIINQFQSYSIIFNQKISEDQSLFPHISTHYRQDHRLSVMLRWWWLHSETKILVSESCGGTCGPKSPTGHFWQAFASTLNKTAFWSWIAAQRLSTASRRKVQWRSGWGTTRMLLDPSIRSYRTMWKRSSDYVRMWTCKYSSTRDNSVFSVW